MSQDETPKIPASTLLNGKQPTVDFDEVRDALREFYTGSINETLLRCLEPLVPMHHEEFIIDMAQFVTFFLTIQIVERSGDAMDRKTIMQAYRKVHKHTDQAVPKMLMEFMDEYQSNQQS
ncbi:MAG: hypothetical protein ACPGWS_04985 [Solirubrobacterales bacterium]